MGQQQLLLIILGVIIVGIAVAVGITMFQDNAINSNRDAVSNDLVNLAARAQQFYRRPVGMGGGGNTFTGLTADVTGIGRLTQNAVNDNGSYSITASAPQAITLRGYGKYTISGPLDSVQVTCAVTPTNYTLTVVR